MLALPAAGALLGAIVGSFLATLCVRWPRGQQAMRGRSACDGCGRALTPLELVPLLSSLALRGRCRECGSRIPRTHFWFEVAAASLVALALALDPGPAGLALSLFWLLLLAPALLDARHYWLPDRLTLALVLAGLSFGGWAFGVGVGERLAGGAAGFLSLALIAAAYRRVRGREGMGAGDPKFLAAIGCWTGAFALPAIVLIACAAGIVAALVLGRGRLQRLPFGTLLALGAIAWSAAGRLTV